MEYLIRNAVTLDIDSILDIWLENYNLNLLDDFKDAKAFLYQQIMQQDHNYHFWVLCNSDDIILAWSSIFLLHPGPIPYVKGHFAENSTYVKREYQYLGLGKKLLSFALDYCKETQVKYVQGFINTQNKSSINMCINLGFEEIYTFDDEENRSSIKLLFYNVPK